MEIKIQRLGQILVVQPQDSRIDAEVSEAFQNDLLGLLEQCRKCLVVDLSRVRFMDSKGVGALMTSLKTMKKAGVGLALVGARGPLADMFRITKLERIIPIYQDANQASLALETARPRPPQGG